MSKMGRKKGGLLRKLVVGEDFRIGVNLALKKFKFTEEDKELEFPSSFDSDERAYIHRLSAEMGLKSKSRGKGASRFITVYKLEGSTIIHSDAKLVLTPTSRQLCCNLLTQHPVTAKERQDLLPPTEKERNPYFFGEARDMSRMMGKLNTGIPQIPPFPSGVTAEMVADRRSLPIFSYKSDIIQAISQNQVIMITGETGSGKTTQVPQFILEHSSSLQIPCRIICSEPRRLAAVAISERVVNERNEKIGQTVGYQIRLESQVSPKTLLTFCTNGVLLRSLMGGDAAVLGSVTHVIVDEIHERDRFSDFLLTVLRDALPRFRNLKLILMSATAEVQLFSGYFSNLVQVSIPGRTFPVEEIGLEQVLIRTRYTTPEMEKFREVCKKSGRPIIEDDDDTVVKNEDLFVDLESLSIVEREVDQSVGGQELEDVGAVGLPLQPLPHEVALKLDAAIADAFISGNFDWLFKEYSADSSLIDYQHSQTRVTSLMSTAAHGLVPLVEQLLALGADISLKALNGWTARDFAQHTGKKDVVEILESYQQSLEPVVHCVSSHTSQKVKVEMTREEREALAVYHRVFNDDNIDYNLIKAIIGYIKNEYKSTEGSILVFLPGYEDIVNMRDLLSPDSSLLVLMLHSQMVTFDQRQIFKHPPPGLRKVILATNIAETSITISDVVFVIDSGKLKEKSYDSMTGISMLKVTWVSQASAIQRKGRAGRCRPGQVYRLFSRRRFESFEKFQTPEMLRTPLMDLCLQTKLLAQPPTTPIADFLARTPEPPSFMATRNAVQMLKTIEALDPWEDVTELGNHLLDLPIEPKLGKTLLYAIVLKCLDPILTIVCCAAYKDPFVLPSNSALRRTVTQTRRKFAADSKSDHMVLLRAFQAWQKAKSEGTEVHFCRSHQISSSTMEMITGMRAQLLGQLRASGFVRAKGSGDIRDLNRNAENWAVVKAALTAGAYPNLARYDAEAQQLRTQKESKVRLHQSSVLLDLSSGLGQGIASNQASLRLLPTDWLIFDEMSRAGRLSMIRDVTAVSPITVAIFAGPNKLPVEVISEADAGVQGNIYLEESSDSEAEEPGEGSFSMLRLDEWATFRAETDIIHLILQMRQKWSALFLRKLNTPSKPLTQADEFVIQTIVSLLTAEEKSLGLTQPSGIGQRPRPISMEGMMQYSSSASQLPRNLDSPDYLKSGADATSYFPYPPSVSIADHSTNFFGTCFPPMSAPPPPHALAGANRYFIIKATNAKAIEVSQAHGLWQFGNQTEKRLIKCIKAGSAVIVIFSIQGSGHFQGYARFLGHTSAEKLAELQSQGQGSGSGIQYWIEWIKRGNIPFQATRHLLNPYNENRKVQTSRDGQEVHPSVGEALCCLWDSFSSSVPKTVPPPVSPLFQGLPTGQVPNPRPFVSQDAHQTFLQFNRKM